MALRDVPRSSGARGTRGRTFSNMSQRLGGLLVLLVGGALAVLGVQQHEIHRDMRALQRSVTSSAGSNAAASTSPAPATTSPTAANAPWDEEYGAEDAADFWWAAQMSNARATARRWEAATFDGTSLAGYGPAHFSCADGKGKVSSRSQSAQCEGVASNGTIGYGTIIDVDLATLDGRWRVTGAHAAGDAG